MLSSRSVAALVQRLAKSATHGARVPILAASLLAVSDGGFVAAALGQPCTVLPNNPPGTHDWCKHFPITFDTAPATGAVEVDWTRKLRAVARVGKFCRDSSGFTLTPTVPSVASGVLLSRIESADAGQNNNCTASAQTLAQWDMLSPTSFSLDTRALGAANPASDRCIGNRQRPARARSRARSVLKMSVDGQDAGTSGTAGFSCAWVNNQNALGGSKQTSKHLKDPVVATLRDPNSLALLGRWEMIKVDSHVLGNGQTKMFNDGPALVTVQNNASDMEYRLEIGSAIVDPADRGVIHVVVRNGVVTQRVLTGRFAGVTGIPLLNAAGTTWQATFSMANIDYDMQVPPGVPSLVEFDLGGSSHSRAEDGLVNPICSLVNLLDEGSDQVDLSMAAAGDSVLGYSCKTGDAAVIENFTPTSDVQPDFAIIPFVSQGVAPGALPSSVLLYIWDQPPTPGGMPIYTSLQTPQASDLEDIEVYRVLSSASGDRTRQIWELTVDLSNAPVLLSGSSYWLQVSMTIPGATTITMPFSPYSDSSIDDAQGYSFATGQYSPLMDPVSGRKPCLPIEIYGAPPSDFPPFPSGNTLEDACFPDGTVLHPYARSPGDPWIPGEWNAESATIIGAASGITPHEGASMLRVNAAGGVASQVGQIVDVGAWATEIDAGLVRLDATALVNTTTATTAPTMFVLAGDSQTVVGTLNPVGGTIIQGFNRASTGFTTDSAPATWQTMRVSLPLPIGTRFVHYEVAGFNATMPSGGVFYDCPSVELVRRLSGDLNCDDFITVGDISGFVLALTDPAQYDVQFPNCDINNADVNGDGFVTVGDIGGFVALLTGV